MKAANQSTSIAVQIMLAEFAAVRNEIQQRIVIQTTITSIYITAIGAIGGVVLTHVSAASALLIVPALALAFHLLATDNSRMIGLLGAYNRDSLWPRLQEVEPNPLVAFSWEHYWKLRSDADHDVSLLRRVLGVQGIYHATATLIFYGGPPLVVAIVGAPWLRILSSHDLPIGLGYILVCSGLATTLLMAVHWDGSWFRYWRDRKAG